jgi:uncharacterized SAM-binding protein YcdF (DUF218 family)
LGRDDLADCHFISLDSKLIDQAALFDPDCLAEFPDSVFILVLGGGHTDDTRLSSTNQLSPSALSRLIEGIRIQRLKPANILVLSGYRGKGDVAHAEVLRRAAVVLGIPPESLRIQPEPSNTYEEAKEFHRLFPDTRRMVLVTSAIHMPRAVYLFRKEGLDPVPAPADYLIKKSKYVNIWRFIVPSGHNIVKMELAIHEYLGMLWARVAVNGNRQSAVFSLQSSVFSRPAL